MGRKRVTKRATQTSNNRKILGIYWLGFLRDNPKVTWKSIFKLILVFHELVHTQTVSYHGHPYSTDPGSGSEHPEQVEFTQDLGVYYLRVCVNNLHRTIISSTRHRSVTWIKYSRLSSFSAHSHGNDNWDCYRKYSSSIRSLLFMVHPRHCTTAFFWDCWIIQLKCALGKSGSLLPIANARAPLLKLIKRAHLRVDEEENTPP